MKKILAVVLVISVVFAAGAAIAQPSRQRMQNFRQPQRFIQSEQGKFERNNNERGKNFGDNERKDQRPQVMPRNFGDDNRKPGMTRGDFCRGPRMRGMRFTPDMPKEIREKVAELAKLKIDLEEALTSNPINKAKALEVHAKMQKLENEIDAWRFERRLEFMEKAREMRKDRPMPPAPKPELEPKDAPEAPEPEEAK